MDFKKIFRKAAGYTRIALIIFVIWTLVGLAFGAFGIIAVSADNRTTENPRMVFFDSVVRAYFWGALSPLVYLFARRFAIDPRRLRFRPIAYNVVFGIALTFFYPLIFVAIARASNANYFAAFPTFWAFFSRQVLVFGWYTLISLYIPTFLTVLALLFLRNYRDEEAKNASLQAELSDARLSALKMQLHPHFLFNSLHSISSLIVLDPRRANSMVALLGDFLRQTLEHSNDQMVTVDEELGFVRCYLDIEKTRFDDRLTVKFNLDEEARNAEVPHLILQPIVENAVKHGISPYSARGFIEISVTKEGGILRLKVSNSGGKKPGLPRPGMVQENGFGLANVESRLTSIYGGAARLSVLDLKDDGFQAELTMPFSAAVVKEYNGRNSSR